MSTSRIPRLASLTVPQAVRWSHCLLPTFEERSWSWKESRRRRSRWAVSLFSLEGEKSHVLVRGHYAVLFGVALGAEMTVFSRSDAKKADALKMGAKRFVATENAGFEKDLAYEFDLIISTANSSKLPLDELLSTLNVGCKLVFVGMPENGFNVTSQTLSGNGAALASSHLGCKPEVLQMLQIAAEKKVKPWINVIPMKDAKKAIQAVDDTSVRYRTVLTQVRGVSSERQDKYSS